MARFWDTLKKYGQEAGNFMLSNPLGPGPAIRGVENARQKYQENQKPADIPGNIVKGMSEGILFGDVPGIRSAARRVISTLPKAVDSTQKYFDPENPDPESFWQKTVFNDDGSESDFSKAISAMDKYLSSGEEVGIPEIKAEAKGPLAKAGKYVYNDLLKPIVNSVATNTFGLGSDMAKNVMEPNTQYQDYKTGFAKLGLQLGTLFDPSSKQRLNVDSAPQEVLANTGKIVEGVFNILTLGEAGVAKEGVLQAAKGVYGPTAQKAALKEVAKIYAKVGAKWGAGFGVGQGLQEGRDKSVGGQLLEAGTAGVANAVIGAGTGLAAPYVGYGANEIGYKTVQGLQKVYQELTSPKMQEVFGKKLKAFVKLPEFGGKGNLEGETKSVTDLISHEGAPDEKTVASYKGMIERGEPVEPIKIIKEGDKWGIEDGKHRYEAYKQLGYEEVPTVDVSKPKTSYSNELKATAPDIQTSKNFDDWLSKQKTDSAVMNEDLQTLKNFYKEVKEGKLEQPRTSMVDSLSSEDQMALQNKVKEINAMQKIVDESDPTDQISIDAKSRMQELQDSIKTNEGTKARLQSMPSEDLHRVMGGEDVAQRISQAQDGPLMRDINKAGLSDNPYDEEMIDKLNKMGWSFDNADEIAQQLTKERTGSRVTAREHTENKLNDWFISDKVQNTRGADEVLTEMHIAEPGYRIHNEGMDTVGVKSSYPQWVPENLRKRALFDSVLEHIQNGTKPKGEAQKALYDIVNAEIRTREGMAAPKNTLLDMEPEQTMRQAAKRVMKGLGRIKFSKDIPEGQVELLKVARQELDPTIKEAIKDDLREYGRVSFANMEILKDQLYARPNVNISPNFTLKEGFTTFNRLTKEFEKVGMTVPDDFKKVYEEKLVDRILNTARGDATAIIDRLEKLGVRADIVKSARIQNKYPLNSAVRIKREANGQVSAVINKGIIDYIKENIKGAPKGERWIKKYSIEAVKKDLSNAVQWWEVPQQFFKRTGLKEVLYDPIRAGERNAEIFKVESKNKLKDVFGKLSKDERKQVTLFFATKQGKGADITKAGLKPVKFTDLNEAQQKVVSAWRSFNKEIEPQLVELAKNHGMDLGTIDWYFPLYTHKDTVKVGALNMMEDAGTLIRKEPFFKSLKEREENVPFKLYEQDSWKLAEAYINGAARFLKVGEKTLPAKYLIDSKEFGEVAGSEIQSHVRSWLKEITSPKSAPDPVETVLRWLRKGAYRSILGLNPRTIAKQAISYLDVGIIEGMNRSEIKLAKQIQKKQGFASVLERVPDISMADLADNVDKTLLGGITYTDKYVAGGNLANVLSSELAKARKASPEGKIDNKAIRQALKVASDKIDLAMGGVTPAQRAKIYRSEAGKLFGMFTSTINSRFQYFIEQGNKGIKTKDAKMLAKVATATFLGAYAEVAITKLALTSGDAAQDAKDTVKSALGNIPMVGSFMMAIDTDKWNPSPAIQNVSDALTYNAKVLSGASDDIMGGIARIAEVAGMPKQLRRSVEGYSEFGGLRETIGGKYIDYDQTKGKAETPELKVTPTSGSGLKRTKSKSPGSTSKTRTLGR